MAEGLGLRAEEAAGAEAFAAAGGEEIGGRTGGCPPRAFSSVFWKAMFLDWISVKLLDSRRKTSCALAFAAAAAEKFRT